MAAQLRLVNYITNFQAGLLQLVQPIPLYNSYNPNYAKEGQFVVWDFVELHQELYTGPQDSKGIDRPIFDISVNVNRANGGLLACAQTVDLILQSWHGYQGLVNMLEVSKIDITVDSHQYDEESSLHSIFLVCQLDVGPPSP